MPELLHVHRRWVDSTIEEAKTNINRIINRWYWLWWVEQFHNCPRCRKPTLKATEGGNLYCTVCGYKIEVIQWKKQKRPF